VSAFRKKFQLGGVKIHIGITNFSPAREKGKESNKESKERAFILKNALQGGKKENKKEWLFLEILVEATAAEGLEKKTMERQRVQGNLWR